MSPDTRKVLVDAMVGFWRMTPEQGEIIAKLAEDDEMLSSLFAIRSLLAGVFRDQDVENAWLRQSKEAFGRKSAMDWMLTGGKDGVRKVKQGVEHLCGM